ncbi:hypothetical protein OEZ86_010563 [Tetradesmus obliquus]|nr:hypothetical protein OEZ86_010563 [Tetradesmus obliquus]
MVKDDASCGHLQALSSTRKVLEVMLPGWSGVRLLLPPRTWCAAPGALTRSSFPRLSSSNALRCNRVQQTAHARPWQPSHAAGSWLISCPAFTIWQLLPTGGMASGS